MDTDTDTDTNIEIYINIDTDTWRVIETRALTLSYIKIVCLKYVRMCV